MKKVLCLLSVVSLAACMGTNDGYVAKDVWEKDGSIHARADVTEKSETLCLNKARINARDKISNYIVTKYVGEDTLTIKNANEDYASKRVSETMSMLSGSEFLIKPWDKKTRTCGVEMIISSDNVESLLN